MLLHEKFERNTINREIFVKFTLRHAGQQNISCAQLLYVLLYVPAVKTVNTPATAFEANVL